MRILPPRKKDWEPGRWQIGLFLRTPKGTVIEFVIDDATKEEGELALKLLNVREAGLGPREP